MTIDEMREQPITDFLHKLGFSAKKRRGSEVWFSAPYRSDSTPSFCVNTAKNLWNDFGLGKGGDIFALAGEIIHTNDFMAQAKYIADVNNSPVEHSEPPRYEAVPAVPQFTDVCVQPLEHPALLGYLWERGIPADTSKANCQEVHYRLKEKAYLAIGFRNESGGYEIRNKFFKGCIPPKAVSLVSKGSATVNVYEGFMDYLSGLALGYGRTEDNLVLNSVANREKAYKHLDGYDLIKCWFDNDKAGRQCLEALQKRYGEKVRDFSVVFNPYKDVNEYLQEQQKNRQQTKSKLKL